jgi:hypothetical protein
MGMKDGFIMDGIGNKAFDHQLLSRENEENGLGVLVTIEREGSEAR